MTTEKSMVDDNTWVKEKGMTTEKPMVDDNNFMMELPPVTSKVISTTTKKPVTTTAEYSKLKLRYFINTKNEYV